MISRFPRRPKTHDLGKLGKQAVELDQTLEPLIDEVVEFTNYAWMFRYPAIRAHVWPHQSFRSSKALLSELLESLCKGRADRMLAMQLYQRGVSVRSKTHSCWRRRAA
jgi:hypothetical protein